MVLLQNVVPVSARFASSWHATHCLEFEMYAIVCEVVQEELGLGKLGQKQIGTRELCLLVRLST